MNTFKALLLEKHQDAYRAVIFDVEKVTPNDAWNGDHKGLHPVSPHFVASVSDILETEAGLDDLRGALEASWPDATHVYMGDGQYMAPEFIGVFDAAEILMADRDKVFTEEGFSHEDFLALTG
jgi:hypothetical protein